jgi:hypothetical protein
MLYGQSAGTQIRKKKKGLFFVARVTPLLSAVSSTQPSRARLRRHQVVDAGAGADWREYPRARVISPKTPLRRLGPLSPHEGTFFFFGGSSVRIVSKKHLQDRPEDQIKQWPRPRPHADRKWGVKEES